MSRSAIFIFATILALSMAPAGAWAQNASQCLQETVGAGSPRGNKASEKPRGNVEQYMRIAKARWEKQVQEKFGGAYATFANASGKQHRCRSATALRRWSCFAMGKPCLGSTLAN